jgi:hypothetical protein
MSAMKPYVYQHHATNVPYVATPRRRCDLCLGDAPNWEWAMEVKLLRLRGDNGKPNDNMLMHILSPYDEHRSALTDCRKLRESGLPGRKAIVIYGFTTTEWPIEIAIDAFETLARARQRIGVRVSAYFDKLVHPIHNSGGVFAWELRETDGETR